jgi:Uma2 family endonuclease
MIVQAERLKFTVDQYEQMGATGILGEDDRVELIDGEIITMSPIGIRHIACVNRLNALLSAVLGRQAIVSVQNPIQLSNHLEPQPDVALLRWRADFYAYKKATAADVLLVIEVAETSLDYDLRTKLPRYGRAGVPQAVLVDLNGDRVLNYTQPVGGTYQVEAEYQRGQSIPVSPVPGLTLDVDAILG